MSGVKFAVTAEQKRVLRNAMLAAEKTACDLQELFKKSLFEAVEETLLDFAYMIATGGELRNERLENLAIASIDSWKFFTSLDELNGNAEEKPEPVATVEKEESQQLDVTYTVTYKATRELPLGESLVDAVRELSKPAVPNGNEAIRYEVEKVELDGTYLEGYRFPSS